MYLIVDDARNEVLPVAIDLAHLAVAGVDTRGDLGDAVALYEQVGGDNFAFVD